MDPTNPNDAGRRFIDQCFADAIAWKAARILLERALPFVDEVETSKGIESMTPESVSQAILRFLAKHPAST